MFKSCSRHKKSCERSSVVEHHLAKVGVAGSNPVVRFRVIAGVAELADAQDLKSCDGYHRTGSIPVLGINLISSTLSSTG